MKIDYFFEKIFPGSSHLRSNIILFGAVCTLVSIVSGFLIGFASFYSSSSSSSTNPDNDELTNYYRKLIAKDASPNDDLEILSRITKEINPENIREHLKYFTGRPHEAGTPGDKITADYVQDQWTSQGLDAIKEFGYDVLLDYPNKDKYNSVQIKVNTKFLKEEIETFEIKEKHYDVDPDPTHISKPFLALGTNGSVETDEVYYANYCDVSDFEFLKSKSIDVTGKIVLCRYGWIFRGNKVKNAEDHGAAAVMIYDDPIRSAPIEVADQIYPKGQFLPKDGTQRGSMNLKEGDPLTPIYPSTESMYRIPINESKYLLKIPGQVIGYELAGKIMALIDSGAEENRAPEDWRGSMNVGYSLGGKLASGTKKLILNVYNQRTVSRIFNVMGVIEGQFEPDRYVMVGNHRDAWTFGAVDPNAGTSCLLEISRVLATLKREKIWEPRRSIVFLSWSGEEYGSQGSTEWVEEYLQKLVANAVVYINMDNVLKGQYSLQVKASPLTFDLLYNLTKNIQVNETQTVFDRWVSNDPLDEEMTLPKISPYMGSGSDHLAFLQRAGVPCIDQRFVRDKKDPIFKHNTNSFPLYHTSYETFNLVTKYLDPEFKISKVISIVAAGSIQKFAGNIFLPFNCVRYADQLVQEFDQFYLANNATLVGTTDVNLRYLNNTVHEFLETATDFHVRLSRVDKTKYHLIRKYNDQLKNLERAFLDPVTLEENGYTHMLYAPSSFNKYSAYSFPTLVESITLYEQNKSDPELLEKVRRRLSIVIYTIKSAISILKEPIDF